MTDLRDEADLGFPMFAYAAILCECGATVAALQLISPDRPFKATTMLGFLTALLLQPRLTIETRIYGTVLSLLAPFCNRTYDAVPVHRQS
jgi:hypothetical protein